MPDDTTNNESDENEVEEEQSLFLPKDIPWRVIAASPDMMDQVYCNKHFPFAWRTSLAISAYEPQPEELAEQLCGDQITYLKITCSITGYQPSQEEQDLGFVSFPDVPTEQISELLEPYWPCYGVLLNVAVFPKVSGELPRPLTLMDYPHILDFEPKMRDLYQTATETGEILTASASSLKTDKSYTHTESTETGIAGGLKGGYTPEKGKAGWGFEGSFSMTHKWGETDKDVRSVTEGASQQRQEKYATTTELNQMFNLLTGYHAGTNRAVFLMLPRPHTLQPTPARTFVQGLRFIEGIQDFFLIVSRPQGIDGLCVEACLETGHFPEGIEIKPPQEQYEVEEEGDYQFPHRVRVRPKSAARKNKMPIDRTVSGLNVDGWELDLTRGDDGHPGITQEILNDDNSEDPPPPRLYEYDYKTQEPGTVLITGKLESGRIHSRTFHRRYTVHRRRKKDILAEPTTDVGKLLITSRGLCVCFRAEEDYLGVLQGDEPTKFLGPPGGIVDERPISVNTSYLTDAVFNQSQMPALKNLMGKIHHAMASSWRMPSRRPYSETGFLETDYFKDHIRKILPKGFLGRPISDVKGLSPEVVKSLGPSFTVSDALDLDLASFSRKTGLDIPDAIKARRKLLGIAPESAKAKQSKEKRAQA